MTLEAGEIQVDWRSRPYVESFEGRGGVDQLSVQVASALGNQQATGRKKRRAELQHHGQAAQGPRRGPVIRVAVRKVSRGSLGPLGQHLHIRESELGNRLVQKLGLFVNRFNQHDLQLRKRNLQRQAGHAATAADVHQAKWSTLPQALEQRQRRGKRIEEMPSLDLCRIGNPRQVEASVALAQCRAQLIQSGDLRVAEPDTQSLGAVEQSAHV